MKKHLAALVGVALSTGILGFTSEAFAYGYLTCNGRNLRWPSDSTRLRASSVSFAPGAYRDALTESISRWNSNPSRWFFNLTYDEPTVDLNNRENEVWFSSDNNVLQNAPAIAYRWWNCTTTTALMLEGDVIFNVSTAYTPSKNKSTLLGYGGSSRPFQTTSTHELGHILPLEHENKFYNAMGSDWTHIQTNAGIATAYPGEDTSNGAVFLYGLYSTPINDVAVVHWKWSGSSGEYSTHQRTQMFSSTGVGLSFYTDAGEPRYYVNRGQAVQVELSYENNGAASLSPNVGFYTSTNDNISTLDSFIGSRTLTLSRDTVLTSRTTVTIPSSLAAGKYYIGAIVDRTNAIPERYENNNATYIAIQVR